MEIAYNNTEEQYIDLILKKTYYSKKHVLKCMFLCLIVAAFFTYLCMKRYNGDIKAYGYLSEASSPVLLTYVICGILWIILLPILYWKIKSMVICREVENLNLDFQGEVKYSLDENDIVITDNYKKVKCNIKDIKSVENKSKYVLLKIKDFDDFLIPKEAFNDEVSIDSFISYINEKIEVKEQVD